MRRLQHSVALLFIVSLLLVALAPSDAAAQRGGGGRGNPRPPGGNRNRDNQRQTIHSIILYGDEVRVVPADTLDDLKKGIQQEYTEAIHAWEGSKKEASKNNEEFSDPKPRRRAFDILVKSVPSKEQADALKPKYVEKLTRSRTIGFAVVSVGDELQVVRNREVDALKESLEQEYRRELRAWEEAKKVAYDMGTAYDRPRPEKSTLKVLPGSFATEEEAKAFQLQAESEKEG